MVETCVGPVGDGAWGEETWGGVREMEVRERGVESAFGGYVPTDCDVIETAEGEICLPLETLDVGAEEGGGVVRGCYPEGGLHEGEAEGDWDGRVCVQREA